MFLSGNLTRCFPKSQNGVRFSVTSSCYSSQRFASSYRGTAEKESGGGCESASFRHAKHGAFNQKRPKITNPFTADIPLQSFINIHVPREVSTDLTSDLEQFGERVVNEIDDLGWDCEVNPPRLEAHDAWGERTDHLKTCETWRRQHDIAAEEGLVAIPYEQKLNQWSRLHQICKLYLYSPSSGLYSCPLAMTDGAAKTILMSKDSVTKENRERLENAFKKLTSRDPKHFWTSGQWMTEKRGGSDVGNSTETVAIPDNDVFRLYGYKWFSSATDANMSLTLGRIQPNASNSKGANNLTMFYVETRNAAGELNNIQLVKLKNKLGTRQLPTAELLLDGCIAHKLSDEGRGISSISHMLNITRLHNAVSAVAVMRRILMLSRDYSQKREAFGQILSKNPLHLRVLSAMEMEVRGSLLLLLKAAILLGKIETNVHTSEEMLLLRLISPVLKLYTAKQAVAVVSEGLESFGGQGYIEDARFPVLLRDSQVLPIWEGTTNVLSLDVIRCIMKTNFEVLSVFEKSVLLCIERGKQTNLQDSYDKVEKSLKYTIEFIQKNPDMLYSAARDIAYSIARTYIGALLIEHAATTKKNTDIFTAEQWCKTQTLCPVSLYENSSQYFKYDYDIVMDGYMFT